MWEHGLVTGIVIDIKHCAPTVFMSHETSYVFSESPVKFTYVVFFTCNTDMKISNTISRKINIIPADKIIEVARTYATTKPALIHDGNGLDQHTNVVQTVRALGILSAVTGNIDGLGVAVHG